jgi:pyruvate/2-oxoglutarate dehydrogenase complex dihydrolipoamide dehydrogenase (E3) component
MHVASVYCSYTRKGHQYSGTKSRPAGIPLIVRTEVRDTAEMPEDSTALADLVRPPAWQNPRARASYDLVVVGGGTAGLVSAMGAAGLGAHVALVERHRLGGDCLNTGCVPSKALLRSARVIGELGRARPLGVTTGPLAVDFPQLMTRMRERRATIAANDSAARLQNAGVDVFFGDAAFSDTRHVRVGDQQLRFGRAVIASGGRPTAPPVPGLDGTDYLTNETVFSLTELPRRLLVIGAGPIGCELAQAFARFGSSVTLLDQSPRVLPREDADAAAAVQQQLETDGVRCELGVRLERVERIGSDTRLWFARADSAMGSHDGDRVLVAAGRAPNIESLGLEAARVAVTREGVVVNDYLRTSNRRVYAAGDVCSPFKFTHAADAMSRIAIQNALFYGRKRVSALIIPWVTYTDPEIAHVGVFDVDATRSQGRIATITVPLSDIDRSIVDDQVDGFVRVHHERGALRGCTIVAPHAGELIGEVTYAMTQQGSVASLSGTVHPYPTVSEAFRKAGDAYRRQSLTPSVRRWLERYFAWTR